MSAQTNTICTKHLNDDVELDLTDDALETFDADERGMSTAEYAVGTIAAASFGTVLLKILTDEQVREALLRIVLKILEAILGGVALPL